MELFLVKAAKDSSKDPSVIAEFTDALETVVAKCLENNETDVNIVDLENAFKSV